ncbi:unnamed protein product, partial [Ectocarpus sp. 4 AP-2014]
RLSLQTEPRDSCRSQTLSVDGRGKAMRNKTDTDKENTEAQAERRDPWRSHASSVDSFGEAIKDKTEIEEENTEVQVEVHEVTIVAAQSTRRLSEQANISK